ncbi:recombinase family protein [Listeria monocytogenes]|nr:recombinase family protein [Listeria monocytogenes]EKZ4336215.1 recombinase family protein [Listeria monocytogenes]
MKKVEIIKANRTITDRNKTHSLQLLRVGAYCRVSTDSEDQLNSYKSQVAYYTNLIKKNKEWVFADIYADEAITGTQVDKRTDFQRLINDCLNGELDMVITKSISRFARNTLDTLKYVRMLKEKNIAVYFEDEKINTLTMDGELLLVVLSSVAQQEVENISANVKKGLKMKMSRGELVGFQGCLGYDYHPEDKSISINEEEAEIVKYIFNRYAEGAGGSIIGRELENLGYKTKRGSSRWAESTILGIVKNEKYKGDILLGKTFTVDPISKRRLANYGEEDQFYLRNHHEAIISEEIFEKAQEILMKRSIPRGAHISNGRNIKRQKYSRKYAFSCMMECGFCGGTLTRRNWHSGSQYKKDIWQCVVSTKKGKKHCPHSKGIPEEAIEKAFVESYRQLCHGKKDVLETFLKKLDETLNESSVEKQFAKIQKKISTLDKKKSNLVDMRLDEKIDKDTYEMKFTETSLKIDELLEERTSLENVLENEHTMKKRLVEFRKTLHNNQVLDEFDRHVFESIVEKVIVGSIEEDGTTDPHKLVFIYKTGLADSQNGVFFKPKRKNAKKTNSVDITNSGLCSQTSNEDSKTSSLASEHARGNRSTLAVKR